MGGGEREEKEKGGSAARAGKYESSGWDLSLSLSFAGREPRATFKSGGG